MLTSHDASAGLRGLHRDHLSSLEDENYHHPRKSRRQHELDELETSKTRRCLKKTTKFLFSHIGLVGLVVVYAVAGAFLFQLLELRQDKLNCLEFQGNLDTEITALKQTILNYIQNNATSSVTSSQDNATAVYSTIGAMLSNYRDYVLRISLQYRSSGDNCSIVNKWTYANSLLFAITIITTIGYGNITPVTWEGQLCAICYATIGIPIFLLCVANISGVLGEMFRFLYAKVICGPCRTIKKRRARAHRKKLEEETGIRSNQPRSSAWKLDNEGHQKIPEQRSSNALPPDEALDEDDVRNNQRTGVPLTITMVIIGTYILIGSVIFYNFEQWTMIQAGYFCFITLATIGFGDLVPGQRKDDPNAGAKMILGAVYVLFGMAILAMCFDLMQEEIVAKFRWIGTKLRIVDQVGEQNPDSIDKHSDFKSKTRSPINDGMNTQRTMLEDGHDSPTQPRLGSGTRKASPRNNITRVHPVGINATNEATLHQRATATKLY